MPLLCAPRVRTTEPLLLAGPLGPGLPPSEALARTNQFQQMFEVGGEVESGLRRL